MKIFLTNVETFPLRKCYVNYECLFLSSFALLKIDLYT